MSEPPDVSIKLWVRNIALVILAPIFWLGFRLRCREKDNIPPSGGVLFVANHISMWDPLMIGFVIAPRRRLFFMAKRELFANPIAAKIVSSGGAFPVDRGGADRDAIRNARDILARGEALLMFPEGTRYRSGQLGPAMPGAGAFGLADDVQVIPVAISGSNRRFGPASITIGGRLDLSDITAGSRAERSQIAADRMMAAIAALLETDRQRTNGVSA